MGVRRYQQRFIIASGLDREHGVPIIGLPEEGHRRQKGQRGLGGSLHHRGGVEEVEDGGGSADVTFVELFIRH